MRYIMQIEVPDDALPKLTEEYGDEVTWDDLSGWFDQALPSSNESKIAGGITTTTTRAAVVTTEEGVTYTPWTDGWAVGFKATHPSGRVEYVYLNPSGGSDDDQSTVFLYQGPHGDSAQDGPVTHLLVFEPDKA